MAWITKRGAYWHAAWKQDGKTIRKSTGIPWEEPGKSAKQLRRTAETQAEATADHTRAAHHMSPTLYMVSACLRTESKRKKIPGKLEGLF